MGDLAEAWSLKVCIAPCLRELVLEKRAGSHSGRTEGRCRGRVGHKASCSAEVFSRSVISVTRRGVQQMGKITVSQVFSISGEENGSLGFARPGQDAAPLPGAPSRPPHYMPLSAPQLQSKVEFVHRKYQVARPMERFTDGVPHRVLDNEHPRLSDSCRGP